MFGFRVIQKDFHEESAGIPLGFRGIPWGFRGIPGGFHGSFHRDSRGIPEDSGGFQGIPPESPKGFHLNGLRVRLSKNRAARGFHSDLQIFARQDEIEKLVPQPPF